YRHSHPHVHYSPPQFVLANGRERIPFCCFRRLLQIAWDMLESMSHALLQLVPSSATANSVPAAEDADECALSLQVRKLGCTQRRIRKLSLGNRIRNPDRVLNVGAPRPQVGPGRHIRGGIAW